MGSLEYEQRRHWLGTSFSCGHNCLNVVSDMSDTDAPVSSSISTVYSFSFTGTRNGGVFYCDPIWYSVSSFSRFILITDCCFLYVTDVARVTLPPWVPFWLAMADCFNVALLSTFVTSHVLETAFSCKVTSFATSIAWSHLAHYLVYTCTWPWFCFHFMGFKCLDILRGRFQTQTHLYDNFASRSSLYWIVPFWMPHTSWSLNISSRVPP